MNLRSIDLNLLVILDALLDEAHVSRASRRLNLSQPATSNALQRCRHLFDDELLERGRGTMRLTQHAEALRGPLKSLLAGVERLVDPPETLLADVERTLRLSMADYPAVTIIQPLQARLRAEAPKIDLVIQPWHGSKVAQAALLAGDTDIAISVFDRELPNICRRELLQETYVVALRDGHPAAVHFNLKRWLEFPHIVVSSQGSTRGNLDDTLDRIGHVRRVGLVVPSFQMVPGVLAQSDMIALLPSRCFPERASAGIVLRDPPIPIPGFSLSMAWLERTSDDVAIKFAIDSLLRVIKGNTV